MLSLVPTPIGNLQDISERAKMVLSEADQIWAEDTRVSGKLLKHLNIQKPLFSFHLNNEHRVLEKVLGELRKNLKLALISDAGTPAISDPGFLLVRACVEEGISVECLPGPTALIPALVISGLPCDRFVFEGFLPPKKGRKTRLEEIAERKITTVFYESPHKIVKCLDQLLEFCGAERRVSVSREISKMYEETFRGNLGDVIAEMKTATIKGEFVVVVGGNNFPK